MARFTVEETNLISIFEESERAATIRALRESLDGWMEPGMREIAHSCIAGLEAITDEEYDAVDLTADYGMPDEWEG